MVHIKSLTPKEFSAHYKLLIADADGTLRRCIVAGQPCPNQANESVTIQEAKPLLSLWNSHKFGIASNQGGVGLGYLSGTAAWSMRANLAVELIHDFNVSLHLVQICGSIDKADPDRKPNPGMLHRVMLAPHSSPDQTLMVGDRDDDRLAAKAAGCDFIWAWDLFGFERSIEKTHFYSTAPEPTELW